MTDGKRHRKAEILSLKLIKRLTVNRLEIQHGGARGYVLELVEPDEQPVTESIVTLTADDMTRFGLEADETLVGAELELVLTAVPLSVDRSSPDTVTITRLSSARETRYHYGSALMGASEQPVYCLELETPAHGGILTLLPATYFELSLSLTETEYRRVRKLPVPSAFQLRLRRAHQCLSDVVLTWRGSLKSVRVFPLDYAERMISLAHAMMAYFGSDIDTVEHHCVIDTDEERPQPGDDDLETWHWKREYLAVDALSAKKWEAPFKARAAQIDAILAERYRHKLSMESIHEFYDHLETSAWESRKAHLIEKLTIGLQAGYVFQGGYHLPSIIIEARSVNGNRKACEVACATLGQEASRLFGVHFDHISLAVEEIGRTQTGASHSR